MSSDSGSKLLPPLKTEDDYVRLFEDDSIWLPPIRVICERHGISTASLRRTDLGTHIVFRAEEYVIKLYCRLRRRDYAVEVACLSELNGLPIPRLVATGDLEGWPYGIVEALEGVPTRRIWRSIDVGQKIPIMRELGEFIRQLHSRPHVAGLPCDWGSFLRQRIARLQEHHHLSGEWFRWTRSFVEPLLGRKEKLVVLNCDLTSDHVFVTKVGEKWRLSGIIDFGDAMIGHPYYEFTAPLLDHAFGEPALARALFDGYGEQLSNDRMDELSRFVLTHRFWSLADIPAHMKSATPQRFLDRLWGRDTGGDIRAKGSIPPQYA